jgi:hypothetical protein
MLEGPHNDSTFIDIWVPIDGFLLNIGILIML